MSDRLIPILSLSCGTLATSYVGLMIATIFFATWQSGAVSSLRLTESQIGNLESTYYQTMNKATALKPSELGFVSPARVQYVPQAQDASAGLSFAGR